jgi:cobalt/nickel transport system permease protein
MISASAFGLFAVHIADGVLPGGVVAGGWVLLLLGLWLVRRELTDEAIPRIGLFTAALFVASQIHFRVGPGSVHLLLTGLAGIVLGRVALVAVAVAVGFQALFFAHGGLTTIGVNGIVLGWSAVFVGWVWPIVGRATWWSGGLAGGWACLQSVTLYGALVWWTIPDAGPAALTAMLLHGPVLAIEAIGTGVIVGYLAKVKPDWLRLDAASAVNPVVSLPQRESPTDPDPGSQELSVSSHPPAPLCPSHQSVEHAPPRPL